MNISDLKKEIGNLKEWLIDVRRDFHEHPELGTQEVRTHKKICEYLDEMGIEHRTLFGTGVVADILGENPEFTIAFRGDIDALPIEDIKNQPYSSKEKGKCHACGHDAHTTIVLGIAKYFVENKIKPPCNLRLIFQPAEETIGGAKPMIEEGALDKVDTIYGLHVDETLNTGFIGIRYGAMNASSDTLEIEIEGESCHGAYPSRGVDAIVIAAQVILAIQSIISRGIDARDSAVITLGTINGGTQGNIIANSVRLTGTIRTLSPDIRKIVKEKIKKIVNTLPESLGGRGIIKITTGYTALVNHDKAVDVIKKSATELLGDKNIYEKPLANMGVEDFAYFVENISGAFFTLGIRNKDKKIEAQAHNGNFDIDEDALVIGVLMQILNIYNTDYHKINL